MQLQKYLRHWTVIWFKWLVHDLVLATPLHPILKLLAIQGHAKKYDEQLWMEGRREVSILSQRPVTSSDLEQERSLFSSVSTFFKLVVAAICFVCRESGQRSFSYCYSPGFFFLSKQSIFLLHMPVKRNRNKLILSPRKSKVFTLTLNFPIILRCSNICMKFG